VIRSEAVKPGSRISGVRSFKLELNDDVNNPPPAAYAVAMNALPFLTVQVTQRRAQLQVVMLVSGGGQEFAEPVTLVFDPGQKFPAYPWWRITYTTELGEKLMPVASAGQRVLSYLRGVFPAAGVRGVGLTGHGIAEAIEAVRGAQDNGDAALRVARKGRILFDGSSINGAAIGSGTLELDGVLDLLFIVHNAGALPRNLTEEMFHTDGTSLIGPTTLRAVVAGAKELGAYGPGALATGAAFAVSRIPPPRSRFQLDAAGAGAARLTIIGR
jgi:hypothetical protein